MMDPNRAAVIYYVLFWLVRINGCIRRGRQPLRRGPEWFFNVRVPPGFYANAGRTLLHQFWLRMLLPFAVDIPIAIVIWRSGHLTLLDWLVIGLSALIHLNHAYSVDLAERQARSLGITNAEEPIASLACSLEPRRASDYAIPALEWALALATAAAVAGLWYRDPRSLLGPPARLLYLQIGFVFAKRLIIAWRAPVPSVQAAEHMAAREMARRYYLRFCDCCRVTVAAELLYWVVRPVHQSPMWFAVWVAFGVAATVVGEIKRKQLLTIALRARPVRLPDLLGQSEIVRWPLCYQPAAPMLVLKGARGYSLNLGNRLAHVGAAYLAGFALVCAL
jgi:hypothetical protein